MRQWDIADSDGLSGSRNGDAMLKVAALSAAGLMCVTALAGCGGGSSSSSDSYCNDVKSAASQFKGISGASLTGTNFTELNAAVHKIADEAPSEIKASWTVLATQLDALQGVLDDVGVSADDFSKLVQGDTSVIDPSKRAQLGKALTSFDTKGITAASNKIDAEAKTLCHIDLNGVSTTSPSP